MPHGIGPLTIKGAAMSVFGLTTVHLCPPVSVEIGPMIPELKLKIEGGLACIELYEYERKVVKLEVKNLTTEAAVTSFTLTCPDADITLPPDSLTSVTQMDASRPYTEIQVAFTALPGMKQISFVCQYSGLNPTCLITISESATLAVKPGLEVKAISIRPLFGYEWFPDLKRWDPSLGVSRSLFPFSEEDDGLTDHNYCQVIMALRNSSQEVMSVEATLSNPSHVVAQVISLRPEQEQSITMALEKSTEDRAQALVDKRLRVGWRAGERKGGIGPLRVNPIEAEHVQPPVVRFKYECGPVILQEFCRLTVTATSQVRLKGHFIYLYRFKETQSGRIALKPEQLVLSGSLSTPFPEEGTEGTLSVKFCAVEEGNYGFVAACGTRKRVAYWASDAFRIQPRRPAFILPS